MSAKTFILCFKWFVARRGIPKQILSDNETTFKGPNTILKLITNPPEITEYFGDLGIQWCFNIERAPWWGGIFERLVQSTKMLTEDGRKSEIDIRRTFNSNYRSGVCFE